MYFKRQSQLPVDQLFGDLHPSADDRVVQWGGEPGEELLVDVLAQV